MSESESHAHAQTALVEESPYNIPSRKLTMWLFLISDAVTFGALLYVYGYIRLATPYWEHPFGTESIVTVMMMTFILLTSSLTMVGAVEASRSADKPKTMRFLASTAGLGLLFTALHLREWWGLFSRNITLNSGLFGQMFFTITGLHLLHIIAGLIALVVVMRGFMRGSLTPGHVESMGLYWHFVDLVWMFIVPLVYLINIAR